MKYLVCLFMLMPVAGPAQTSYKDSIAVHRNNYGTEFNKEFHSKDSAYLRYYEPDVSYRVVANLKATPDSKPFQITTHSGITKTCKEYGLLSFEIKGAAYTLHVYQLPDVIKKNPSLKNELFVPFTDETTYQETFGGGRYIDLQIPDIKDNKIVLDFNKCYNPSCAYASGFSCPIPPKENDLHVAIKAGEKLFGKEVK